MNLYTDDDIIPTTPDPTGNTLGTENKIITVDSDDDSNQHLLDIYRDPNRPMTQASPRQDLPAMMIDDSNNHNFQNQE